MTPIVLLVDDDRSTRELLAALANDPSAASALGVAFQKPCDFDELGSVEEIADWCVQRIKEVRHEIVVVLLDLDLKLKQELTASMIEDIASVYIYNQRNKAYFQGLAVQIIGMERLPNPPVPVLYYLQTRAGLVPLRPSTSLPPGYFVAQTLHPLSRTVTMQEEDAALARGKLMKLGWGCDAQDDDPGLIALKLYIKEFVEKLNMAVQKIVSHDDPFIAQILHLYATMSDDTDAWTHDWISRHPEAIATLGFPGGNTPWKDCERTYVAKVLAQICGEELPSALTKRVKTISKAQLRRILQDLDCEPCILDFRDTEQFGFPAQPALAFLLPLRSLIAELVTVHGVAGRAGAEVAVGCRGKRSNPVAS